MVSPIAQYGDIEHGIIKNITSRNTVRDTVSISGAGDKGLFVRHIVIENIRAFDSKLRSGNMATVRTGNSGDTNTNSN